MLLCAFGEGNDAAALHFGAAFESFGNNVLSHGKTFITVEESNPIYASDGGSLYSKDKKSRYYTYIG